MTPVGSTRDFLLVPGGGCPTESLERWHLALGGGAECWVSTVLNCRLFGRATLSQPASPIPGAPRVACVLVGAPFAFGSLEPDVIQARLVADYEAGGISALTRVFGSFCGVLADEQRQRLWVFSDRFGFRKAFVHRVNSAAIASSRAIVLAEALGLELDEVGVLFTTLVGHTLGRRTLFRGCEAVMPATAMDLVSSTAERYWDIQQYAAGRRRTPRETSVLVDHFNDACRGVVLAQDVPALNLTGGYDTRAILSAATTLAPSARAVTFCRSEHAIIDRLIGATGVRHQYFEPEDQPDWDVVFAFLTDGECDAIGGGRGLRYWQDAGRFAPSGCLHGGLGEVWRSYHYKYLLPTEGAIRRDPVQFLVERLVRERADLSRLLASDVKHRAADMLREDVAEVWDTVKGSDALLPAIDVFYLLERNRGLTRIASAAELFNRAYAPFGHAPFLEAGLGYLGPQNRGESLHRAIISVNAPHLARVSIHGGGDATVQRPWTRGLMLAGTTARHYVGGVLGVSLRSRLQRRLQSRLASPATQKLDPPGALFDPAAVSSMWEDPSSRSRLGNVYALALLGQRDDYLRRARQVIGSPDPGRPQPPAEGRASAS